MAKINKNEYEVLKDLDDKWQWIARDKDNSLYVYFGKPIKEYTFWEDEELIYKYIDEDLFQFIQWEDENPYHIQDLIEEYESEYHIKNAKIVKLDANKLAGNASDYKHFYKRVGESEETEMKKDLNWLKEEIEEDIKSWGGGNPDYFRGAEDAYENVKDWLNQLDEPEVLSQKWISENIEYAYFDMLDDSGRLSSATAVIKPNKLKNLLVSKQEKVRVDKEVAENIKHYKEEGWTLFHLITDIGAYANHDELLAQAWLAYPNIEVEEEQKYYVIFPSMDENCKGFNYLAKDTYHNELWVEDSRTDGLVWEERSSFTEDEIRDLDKGDILFEHFAVKVEEVEG